MNEPGQTPPDPAQAPPAAPAAAPALPVPVPAALPPPVSRGVTVPRSALALLVLMAGGALVVGLLLWQNLSHIQQQLARQSTDSAATALAARALAQQAQEVARDAAARQVLLESRVNEVALQRSQLEELMQSLSRSRDENLVVDVESALRLAQQQSQLTGSAEPLLAALRTADQRLTRAAQPRLARVRAAIARDIDRIKAAAVTDVPGVLARLDDLARQVDDLPVANAVPPRASLDAGRRQALPAAEAVWWRKWRDAVVDEARGLVRVSRIDQPEAALLAPEQSFFLRENLKLKLLNARLSLLARQNEAARADLAAAATALHKYFDPGARRTQQAATLMQQVQAQVRVAEVPRMDETLAALATAAAGR
jgi:uroporphyrin-3 C-methyltransferase